MSGTNGKHSQVTELLEAAVDIVKNPQKTDTLASESPSGKSVWLSRAFTAIVTFYFTTVFLVILSQVLKLFGTK